MFGASAANVFQAREQVKRFPLFAMLDLGDAARRADGRRDRARVAGPPVFEARLGYWLGAGLSRLVRLGAGLQPLLCRWCARSGRARRLIRACWCRSSRWAFRPGSKAIAGRPAWPALPAAACSRSAEWLGALSRSRSVVAGPRRRLSRRMAMSDARTRPPKHRPRPTHVDHPPRGLSPARLAGAGNRARFRARSRSDARPRDAAASSATASTTARCGSTATS